MKKKKIDSENPEIQTNLLSILIVEDQELVRYGLRCTLEKTGRFSAVGEAENGQQALDYVRKEMPDIVLMDITMPVMDGITATRTIKQEFPETKVIMLTSHTETEEVFASLASNADAYCLKDIKVEWLCQVIEMVKGGALWIDPAVARLVIGALPEAPNAKESASENATRKRYNVDLTNREREVLELIVSGKSNKEIAAHLVVTTHTAKAHVSNIIQKLAVDDRTQVAVKAIQEGLVQPSLN